MLLQNNYFCISVFCLATELTICYDFFATGRPSPPAYFEALEYPRSANDYEFFEKLQHHDKTNLKVSHANGYSVAYTPVRSWEAANGSLSKTIQVYSDECTPSTSGYTYQANLKVPGCNQKSASHTSLYLPIPNEQSTSQTSLFIPENSASQTSLCVAGTSGMSTSKTSVCDLPVRGSTTCVYYGSQQDVSTGHRKKSSSYRVPIVTEAERTAATLVSIVVCIA